jgi:hypothetical protein
VGAGHHSDAAAEGGTKAHYAPSATPRHGRGCMRGRRCAGRGAVGRGDAAASTAGPRRRSGGAHIHRGKWGCLEKARRRQGAHGARTRGGEPPRRRAFTSASAEGATARSPRVRVRACLSGGGFVRAGGGRRARCAGASSVVPARRWHRRRMRAVAGVVGAPDFVVCVAGRGVPSRDTWPGGGGAVLPSSSSSSPSRDGRDVARWLRHCGEGPASGCS